MSVSSPSISTRVDARLREEVAVGPRGRPGGVAEDRDRARGAWLHREREDEHLVPVVAGEVRIGVADRVHRLALVELERARAVAGFDDARVLVLGVGVVDDARAGVRLALDRPDRQREQEGEDERRDDVRRAREPDRRDDDEHEPERDERAARADERDEQQRGGPGPEQAADGRDRVEPPGHPARLRDVGDGEPERVRRDRAGDEDRGRDEDRHAEQRSDERARRDRVERVGGDAEEGVGDERHDREQQAREQHDPVEPGARRVAVGELAAVPVADRQRDEHDPDRVRPHDRRGAEVRREQARGRDLGAEDAEADREDDKGQRWLGETAHGARSVVGGGCGGRGCELLGA